MTRDTKTLRQIGTVTRALGTLILGLALAACASTPAPPPASRPAAAVKRVVPQAAPTATARESPPEPLPEPATTSRALPAPPIGAEAAVEPLAAEASPASPSYPDDLWADVRAGMRLPDHDHSGIQASLAWYSGNRDYTQMVLRRAEPYLHFIMEEVNARGLPTELALLPAIESAFRPFAYSAGNAAGLWQFIPDTGRLFGLKQTWWYDGRRDVYASTRAALDYLKVLGQRFNGDWLLALAAYNAGDGTLRRAIEKNRALGLPTDYWSLDLSAQARGYVPKLLAISRIVADPAAFRVTLPSIAREAYFTRVDTGGQIDLALAAKLAELSMDEFHLLNPAFNRPTTPPEGPHYLLVPKDKAALLVEGLAQHATHPTLKMARHEVAPRETLSGIARRYGSSVDSLRRANGLRDNTLRIGAELMIPVPSTRKAGTNTQTAGTGSTPARLAGAKSTRAGASAGRHTVKAGETLWAIAGKHGVKIVDLLAWNGLAANARIRPGQSLFLHQGAHSSPTEVASAPVAPPNEALTQRVRYQVREGDTLATVSRKFRVTIPDLRRWNEMDTGARLEPGQALTLFVDLTKVSGTI